MDRTSIIAITLALAVLIGWQVKLSRDQMAARKAQPAASPAPAAQAQPAPAVQPPSIQPAKPFFATGQPVKGEITKAGSASAEYEFTNVGGGIERVVLLKH